jgi:glycosyltransferase involved in cell wall biosynthesis
MRILFISSIFLSADSKFGGAKRLYSFVKGLLCAGHNVDVICLDGSNESKHLSTDLNNLRVFKVPSRRFSIVERLFKSPADLTAHLYKHRRQLQQPFSVINSYDAIIFAYPPALSFHQLLFKYYTHNNCIYIDDDFLLNTIRAGSQSLSSSLYKTIKTIRAKQLEKFLVSRLRHFRTMVCISEREKQIAQKWYPWLQFTIIKHAMHIQSIQMSYAKTRNTSIGFIGNFSHHPNVSALSYFLSQIWPFIKLHLPATRFIIAGDGSPAELMKSYNYLNDPNITFLGKIDHLAAFYNYISIFINPATSEGGLRTKVIEAAAYGRPIISTQAGASGCDDIHISLAQSAEEWISAIKRLSHRSINHKIARRNRAIAERNYSVESAAKRLLTTIQICE